MRTPTALLRIGAALGNQAAKQTLNDRRLLQPLSHKDVQYLKNTGSWVGAHPASTAAAPHRPCAPLAVSNRTAPREPLMAPVLANSPAMTSNTSWLHHGFGATPRQEPAPASDRARVPVPADGNELHPLALKQLSVVHGPFDGMSELNQQATALINAELDSDTMFGELDPPDTASTPSTAMLLVADHDAQEGSPIIPDVDYESDDDVTCGDFHSITTSGRASIASLADEDSGDEWDELTPEELAIADQRFRDEDEQIAQFARLFAESHTVAQAPSVPEAPPAPVDGHAVSGHSVDANVATFLQSIREEGARRQGVVVEIADKSDTVYLTSAESILQKSLNSLEKIHSFEVSSDEEDSGKGSGYASDLGHDWS